MGSTRRSRIRADLRRGPRRRRRQQGNARRTPIHGGRHCRHGGAVPLSESLLRQPRRVWSDFAIGFPSWNRAPEHWSCLDGRARRAPPVLTVEPDRQLPPEPEAARPNGRTGVREPPPVPSDGVGGPSADRRSARPGRAVGARSGFDPPCLARDRERGGSRRSSSLGVRPPRRAAEGRGRNPGSHRHHLPDRERCVGALCSGSRVRGWVVDRAVADRPWRGANRDSRPARTHGDQRDRGPRRRARRGARCNARPCHSRRTHEHGPLPLPMSGAHPVGEVSS